MSLSDINPDEIKDIAQAKEAIRQLMNAYETLLQVYNNLQEENVLLRQENDRLKKQSRKPQFSKGRGSSSSLTPTTHLRDKEDTKSWHKSKRKEIPIDQDIQLPEVDACLCGSTQFATVKTTAKVVQGLLIKRNNTAYHGRKKQCVKCGKVYTTPIPRDVKGLSFDSNLTSLVSLFKFYGRYTHPLLHNFLTMFGIQISYGEITKILQRNSQKLHSSYLQLKTVGIGQSSYVQSDATGTKRKQLAAQRIVNQHLHFFGNQLLSVFKITMKYNASVLNEFLGKRGRRKIFVSDDGSPNGGKLKVKKKQLCWVHEDRHYTKLSPRLTIHREKLEEVLNQLGEFYHYAKAYGRDPTVEGKKRLRKMFDAITNQTTGYEALDHQLMLTKHKRDRLLLFLDYPFLPIQNNQAERDLREFVIIRKISRETKSLAGDRSIERHLSIIQTAKKQGLDVFQTLHGLLTGELSPSVLTAKAI